MWGGQNYMNILNRFAKGRSETEMEFGGQNSEGEKFEINEGHLAEGPSGSWNQLSYGQIR